MPVLISILTILFILSGFIVTPSSPATSFLTEYISTQKTFIANNNTVFLVGYLVFLVFAFRFTTLKKTHSFAKKFMFSTIQFAEALFISLFFALGILLLIGFIEITIFATLIDTNPAELGVIQDTRTIVNTLQTDATVPEIIVSDTDPSKEVIAVATATTGKTNFYGKYVLSIIPSFLIIPVKQAHSSMLLIDNTLIITRLSAPDLQAVSPILGYLFVKQYFPDRVIKHYPNIAIMNQSQYADFRKNDLAKNSAQIDIDIQKVQADISSTSAKIDLEKKELADNQPTIISNNAQLTAQYNTCIAAGYYRHGTFYRYHTDADCQKIKDQIVPVDQLSSSQIDSLQTDLQSKQDYLTIYQAYKNFFASQKNITSTTAQKIGNENGLFEPTNFVTVNLDTTDPHAVADYLETVTHEYLHYASFISTKQVFTDSFFEESLTEYFARQAIQDALNTTTNLGYPLQVKIITDMMKRIPENQFADMYFTKDENLLETTLDATYGNGFYKKNETLFDLLQYASNPQQKLQIANKIMAAIGGPTLHQKDLYSRFSSLQ